MDDTYIRQIPMKPNKPPKPSQPEITEPTLQAEILKQDFQETIAQLDLDLQTLRQKRAEWRRELHNKNFISTRNSNEIDGLLGLLLPLAEQRRELETTKGELQRVFIRKAWRQSSTVSQRANVVKRWAPLWSKRVLWNKPRVYLGLWAVKLGSRLIRKTGP